VSGMTEQDEPRKLTGEAAWKAHLNEVDKRNAEARRKAADARSAADSAAVARAYRLKGD
jgi:flagellar hook-length control protein FliK